MGGLLLLCGGAEEACGEILIALVSRSLFSYTTKAQRHKGTKARSDPVVINGAGDPMWSAPEQFIRIRVADYYIERGH